MTEPELVVLAELDRVGAVRRLDDDHATALATTRLVEVRPEGGGHWRLLPAGRVGVVRIGDLEVRVQPKTGIARLLFLLGYAADPGFRPEDVAGVPEPELWPALAESLARQVERALGPGVLQGYVTIDESLPLVRGRIRVADQMARRPGLLLPLEVRYDEYAPDIPENRLIRSALRRMLAVPGLRRELSARLAHLDGRLDGVQVLLPGTALPTWRLTRLNARYAAALRLAEIVLRNQSAEPGPGGVSVAAFVVSMAKVFQDFVTVALREAIAPHPGHTEAQYPGHLDEQRKIAILPDVVHVVADQPVAVFDAKYRLEDASSSYPNADVYQMLAYCTALQLPRGWLVYAQGNAPPGVRRVRHTSINIIQYPLDLAASPADLLRQVETLAGTALGLTREEPSTVTVAFDNVDAPPVGYLQVSQDAPASARPQVGLGLGGGAVQDDAAALVTAVTAALHCCSLLAASPAAWARVIRPAIAAHLGFPAGQPGQDAPVERAQVDPGRRARLIQQQRVCGAIQPTPGSARNAS